MKSTTIYKHTGTVTLENDMGNAQPSLDRYEFRNGRSKLCDFPSYGLRAVPYTDPDAKNLVDQKSGVDTYFAVKFDLCHIFSKDDYEKFMHYPTDHNSGMISYEAMRQSGYSGVVVHYDPLTMQNDPLLKSWKGDFAMIWDQSSVVPVSKEIADLARIAEAPDPTIDVEKLNKWAKENLNEIQQCINNDVIKYSDAVYVLGEMDGLHDKIRYTMQEQDMDLNRGPSHEIESHFDSRDQGI